MLADPFLNDSAFGHGWMPPATGRNRYIAGVGDLVTPMRLGATLVRVLIRRPGLVPTALRQLRSMAPHRWWAKAPYLPIPPGDYLEFRNVTSTGTSTAVPTEHDVEVWLDWCRSLRGLGSGHSRSAHSTPSPVIPTSPPTGAR